MKKEQNYVNIYLYDFICIIIKLWRIAIYYIPAVHDCSIEFHIARQDEDGCWSEKPSWKAKISRFAEKTDTPPDLSKYGLKLENILILSK